MPVSSPRVSGPVLRTVLLCLALLITVSSGAMAQIGTIAGKVTRDDNGQPVPQDTVLYLRTPQGGFVGSTITNGSGDYSLAVVPGEYVLQAKPSLGENPGNLVDEYHSNFLCPGPACGPAGATRIAVNSGQTTTVNVGLTPGGSISGTIKDSSSNANLADVLVTAWLRVGATVPVQLASQATSTAAGTYEIRGLPAGGYTVQTVEAGVHIDEVYDANPAANRYCPGTACVLNQGAAVAVTQGASTQNINFALEVGGKIAGHVLAAGSPLPFAEVGAFLALPGGGHAFAGLASTDTSGDYLLDGLPPGNYALRTSNFATGPGYVDEMYNDIPCPAQNCDLNIATPVPVAGSATVPGIHFALSEGGIIEGVVQEDCGEGPCPAITGADVEVYDAAGTFVCLASPDFTGRFFTPALPAGTYRSTVLTYSGNYVDEAFDNVDCVGELCDATAILGSTPLVLTAGTSTFANFFLRAGGIIGGSIAAANQSPVPGASVNVYRVMQGAERLVKHTASDAFGAYSIGGLPGTLTEYRAVAVEALPGIH